MVRFLLSSKDNLLGPRKCMMIKPCILNWRYMFLIWIKMLPMSRKGRIWVVFQMSSHQKNAKITTESKLFQRQCSFVCFFVCLDDAQGSWTWNVSGVVADYMVRLWLPFFLWLRTWVFLPSTAWELTSAWCTGTYGEGFLHETKISI